jgi:putative NADH-flavin reductase
MCNTIFFKGFAVRAFVRDPAKLPEDLRSKTEVIQGDVLNPEDVKRGVKDQEGVIVALGTRNDLGKFVYIGFNKYTVSEIKL